MKFQKLFVGVLILTTLINATGCSVKFDKEEFKSAFSDKKENVKDAKTETKKEDVAETVIIDVMQYWTSETTTITEKELIEQLGEPDSVDEWEYEGSYQVLVDKTPVYLIRSLYYGNYEYLFNDDMLQRININEEIPYKNTDNILTMFGLKEYSNTKITNNNISYRVSNCGVPDFWVYSMDEDSLDGIKISYGTFWGE